MSLAMRGSTIVNRPLLKLLTTVVPVKVAIMTALRALETPTGLGCGAGSRSVYTIGCSSSFATGRIISKDTSVVGVRDMFVVGQKDLCENGLWKELCRSAVFV